MQTASLTIADVLRSHARTRPHDLAVADGGVRLGWRAFHARTNRVANALRAAGVEPGDRVLWLGQNSVRVQELLLACSKIGAAFCPANWRQSPDEIAFLLEDLDARVVVGQDAEVGDAVAAGRARAPGAARWIIHDRRSAGGQTGGQPGERPDEYEAFVADAPDHDPGLAVGADDPVLFIYTAAFGGRPNAAMLSSRAILAQALLMAPMMGVTDRHVYLNAGPMFHIGVFMENFATHVMGGTNVFVPRSDGHAIAAAIERERCTGGYVVGPMVDAVVEAMAQRPYDISSLRGYRANPVWDAAVGADESPWGRRPGGYGQTEVMGMCTFNLLAEPGAQGLHGRPSPLVQIAMFGPDECEVEPGETGEICVRGATVMNGYWNRPDLNAARARNGWHHTNDLGRYEADGTITFIGPKGRMLKSAAENIYPAEVEGALRSHPAVADVAVIGVPDPVWVQSVKAVVVLAAGATATEAELIEHCRQRIASYKKPRTVEFVDALPRQGWAVDYDALDARFGGGGYPGGTTRSV